MKQKKIKRLVIFLIVISLFFIVGCARSEIQNNIYEINLDEILSYKNSEFRDLSKVNKILENLPANINLNDILIVDQDEGEVDENLNKIEVNYNYFESTEIKFEDESLIKASAFEVVETNAIILFSLIKDLDAVNIVIGDDTSIVFMRSVLVNSYRHKYNDEVPDITENKEILEGFIRR